MLASVRFRLKTRHVVTLLLLSTVLLIQTAQSVPLSSQSLLKAPNSMNPSDSMAGSTSTLTSTSISNQSITANWPAWKKYMSQIPVPQAVSKWGNCFAATYPSTVWQTTKCVTTPSVPLLPKMGSTKPLTVGYGVDYVAQSSGTLIGNSLGSFQPVTGLTSETDVCPPAFVSYCGNGQGPNYFGLQDNSNTFTTSTTYTGGKSTTGWEQFVFLNDPGANLGYIFIQYWLLGYYSSYGSCPTDFSQSGTDCFASTTSATVPSQTATNLAKLSLGGYANFGSNGYDVDEFCIVGTGCDRIEITDQVLNLYQHWTDAEFNVFGYGNLSEANFNSGTTITVVNSLVDESGNAIAPSCYYYGYTGETNNLNLVPSSCSANSSNGEIVFTESNAPPQTLTTSVASGSGSVSPSCPSGCSETVGSSISVTATPSSGWTFSSWSVTGASCSGGSTGNPCQFTMPSSAVAVSATFTSPTYSATFAESGIPSGTTWGVTVNGNHQSTSSGTSIQVSGLTGTVSYSYDSLVAGSGGSYSCTSSCSGQVSSSGTVTATYTFSSSTYSATFAENNIPSGVTWGVTVGGTHHQTSSGTSIPVSGLTGTVSYSYDSPVAGSGGSYTCTSSCSGSVSGSATVTATYTFTQTETISVSTDMTSYCARTIDTVYCQRFHPERRSKKLSHN